MLQQIGRFLLSPFLWQRKQIVLDVSREWVLEMELDPEEPQVPAEPIFIAQVARFGAGEVQCGRWAYSPPGIWRCLDTFFVEMDQEVRDTYQRYYYLQTGERVELPAPPAPVAATTDPEAPRGKGLS